MDSSSLIKSMMSKMRLMRTKCLWSSLISDADWMKLCNLYFPSSSASLSCHKAFNAFVLFDLSFVLILDRSLKSPWKWESIIWSWDLLLKSSWPDLGSSSNGFRVSRPTVWMVPPICSTLCIRVGIPVYNPITDYSYHYVQRLLLLCVVESEPDHEC